MEKTTIQLNVGTLEKLKMLKKYERETYDEIVCNLVDDALEESLTDKEILEIQEALEEVKKGQVYSIEEVAKELGVLLK
ncbi:MAG: hypothetical protein KKG60_00435 [Nanoarchaeota archaeon]|nr:hypothetical protein [Nanoarchaeota archaeon]